MSASEGPATGQISKITQKSDERRPIRAVGAELFCVNRALWA
jgi:hypothetical protein